MAGESSSARRRKESIKKDKRSQVLSACRRCRQQKKRCDGQRPACGNCVRFDRECDYENIAADENRAGAARRQTAALQTQVNDISESLDVLKSMSDDDALQWLSDLRSAVDPLPVLQSLRYTATGGAPLPAQPSETLMNCSHLAPSLSTLDLALARDHSTIYPPLALGETASKADNPSAWFAEHRSRPDIRAEGDQAAHDTNARFSSVRERQLCDDRLNNLDIAYWTTIPISNNLAAHVLSLYFQTDHPLLSPFDADLFIQDLTTNSARFCSSLLVNSVLSWACQTYCTILPDAAGFVKDFMAAAVRLLEAEEDCSSILKVASLFCLTLSSICSGDQAASGTYLIDFLQMAVSLRLHGKNVAEAGELGLFLPDWISAYSCVAWGSYNFCCVHLFHYRAAALNKFVSRPPLLPIPTAQAPDSPNLSFNPQPDYIGRSFEMYCHLLPLCPGILTTYKDETVFPVESKTLAFAEEKYQELLRWSRLVPLSLSRTWAMPHHAMVLHASFHSLVMELFRPFLHQNLTLSIPTRQNTRVEEIFLSSSTRMIELNRLYYSKYHNQHPSRTVTWFLIPVYAAHNSLRGPAETRKERQYDFKLAMQGFKGIGMTLPMRESIIHGCMTMAVSSGLLSLRESRRMSSEILGSSSSTSSDTALMIDFDAAMKDPQVSSVEALSRQYDAMTVLEE